MEPIVLHPRSRSSGGGCSASACAGKTGQPAQLPETVREKIQDHPCYSEQAHHYFARMHVAVAPACNIQCHYCNRKYDCANESRPGVVSELLSPEQAVRKTLAVAARIPQLSVLGIAGPGDPLANPARTFATFRMLSEQAPDLKLCVSTNGLALPGYVDELLTHNIGHVTITINCVDPAVGAAIHPWIFWKNRRLRGLKAASILIEQQLQGLEMLVARGVLVKVNSVMIPGVNDQHLQEVSRVVKARGAFLHNVMPLISEPEHGTFYGVMGQRGPSAEELTALRDTCGGNMNMMRHCRQCRADAVGLLGEDRGAEFTLDRIEETVDPRAAMEKRTAVHAAIRETMAARQTPPPADTATRPVLMAVATRGDDLINQHFGHAQEFLIYQASPAGVRLVGHRRLDARYCQGSDTCGEGEARLSHIIETLAGCEAVLCARIGHGPWTQLEAAGITPNGEHAMAPIEEAVAAVYREMLETGRLAAPADAARIA